MGWSWGSAEEGLPAAEDESVYIGVTREDSDHEEATPMTQTHGGMWRSDLLKVDYLLGCMNNL